MKIVLHAYNYSGNDSGVGLISRTLMERMVEKGHDVYAIAQQRNVLTNKLLPKKEIMNGVKTIRIKRLNIKILGSVIYYLKVLNTISRLKPDIIHEMGLCGIGYFAKRMMGIPYCVMGQGIDIYDTPWLFEKTIGKSTIKSADAVLAPTNHLARFTKEIYADRQVEIVRSGINMKDFKIKKRKSKPFKIVAVGRLIPAKGFDITLKALAKLKNEIKFEFVIIGSGTERKTLEQLAEKLGIRKSVKFTGQIPHKKVADILMNSNMFVYPTKHPETCSLAILEANAAGLPIITSNLQGNAELVSHGENGYLIDPDNLSEMCKRIMELYYDRNKRERFSKKSKEISKKFEWDTIATKLEHIYEHILKHSRKV